VKIYYSFDYNEVAVEVEVISLSSLPSVVVFSDCRLRSKKVNKDTMVIGRVLVPPGWKMTYPEGTTIEAHGSHQTNTARTNQ